MKIQKLFDCSKPLMGVTIILIISYFVIIIYEVVSISKSSSEVSSNVDDSDTININIIEATLLLIGTVIVCILAIYTKLAIIIALSSIGPILQNTINMFHGIDSMHTYIENNVYKYSINKQFNVLLVSLCMFCIPSAISEYFADYLLNRDWEIIIVTAIFACSISYSIVTLLVFIIDELSNLFHFVNISCKLLDIKSKSVLFRKISILSLWNVLVKNIKSNCKIIRVLRYMISYTICIIVSVAIVSISFIQNFMRYCLIILWYNFRFIEYLLSKIYHISDSKLLWTSIRWSIILGLVFSEIMLVNSHAISSNSQIIFEFISETVLIPMVINEISKAETLFSTGK